MTNCIRAGLPAIFVAVFVMLAVPRAVFANSTISSVTRINVSEGSIKGENAEYTFVLPKSWQNSSVTVNREKADYSSPFRDKLIFLYIPLDKISKPTVFATLYVYDSRRSPQDSGLRRVLETDKYVFIIESLGKNNLTDTADKAALDQYIQSSVNDSLMASQIEVPSYQRKIPLNTITVNGRLLAGKVIQSPSGTIYIPVRETCIALGCSVGWDGEDSRATVYSGDRQIPISVNADAPQSYSTLMLNDRSYVTSVFFMRELKASVDVDSNNNVIIRTAGS